MKLCDIHNFLFGTLRGRLILGVAAVHAVIMTVFIIDLTVRQRAMLLDRQEEEATALAHSLSTSSAEWLAANDISGLQELVEAQRSYPEFLFAMLIDKRGRVLAHTDKSMRGQFLLDLPGKARQTVISKTTDLVDVAVPALLAGRYVGWARVGIGQKAAGKKLAEITRSGALYTGAAILLGSIIAWLMGRQITRRLYVVQETMKRVHAGDRLVRAPVIGTDEAAVMAREFNVMLDVLAERSAELREKNLLLSTQAETLEVKVRERTKQLEDANTELQLLNDELTLRRQEAEDSRNRADEASRAKSDFLANMSHELRTPLNSIIGFSDILMEGMAGTLTDEQKDLVNDISTSGRHLLSVINDILDLSKVEAGRMELETGEFDLGQLVIGSLGLFREKALKHNIKLTSELGEDLGIITADERKIKQVMFNLVGNAMKFTPDGGAVMVNARRAKCQAPGQDGDCIEISVDDTGIGISDKDLKKLFQPFQQIDSALSRQYAGTGLGLKLCKDFVELHGGRIWVESEAGKGSRFMFAIPSGQMTNHTGR